MKSWSGRIGLLSLLLVASLASNLPAQTATITTSDPITFIKGISSVTRPVRPDEIFTVGAVNGDQITIVDGKGYQATLNRNILKITNPPPPAPATNAAPAEIASTNLAPATATSPDASPSSQPPAASPAISPEDAGMIKQLNDAFQIPLFANTNLWNEDAGTVADRLRWPQESNTSYDASYRRYALGDHGVTILGARAYSMALYARNGHPTYISIVFANKGDFKESQQGDNPQDDLNAAIKKDAQTIAAQLTAVLGDPESRVFGISADDRENVHRWTWNGHAILLTHPEDEYAAIKIMPSTVADQHGDVGNLELDSGAIKEALAKRVLKRDNGDVVLQDIPMVDQGPKGYCVPATWERYLRYVDVPADMYVLAMLGHTAGANGGTNVDGMRNAVNSYVESYHRSVGSVETNEGKLEVEQLAKRIDQGLPLMWTCLVYKSVENMINQHTAERKSITDWIAYKAKLDADDAFLKQLKPSDVLGGHMRMIIGYNVQTNELAISDSCGPYGAERWITLKEAQATSENELDYVEW